MSKKIKFKNVSAEEYEAKLMVLKGSELFQENELNMIKKAMEMNTECVFSDKQAELLQMMQVVEKSETIKEREEEAPVIKEGEEYKRGVIAPSERVVSDSDKDEEKVIEATEEYDDDKVKEIASVKENTTEEGKTEEEVNATIKVDVEQEEKQEFVPESPEEIAQMTPEQIGKMYYLTGDRMIETIKQINNGELWKKLGAIGENKEVQYAIEKAYKSAVYPGDLVNPDFLDNRINQYLPEDNQMGEVKDMHKAVLMGTYVGYHISQNENRGNNIEAKEPTGKRIAVVEFPMVVENMPDSLKDKTEKDLEEAITTRIKEIMDMPNSYKALMMLVPIEDTIDEAIDEHVEDLGNGKEAKAMKAYISLIRADDDVREASIGEMNTDLDLSDIDMSDINTVKSVVGMIEQLQINGKTEEIEKIIKNIDIDLEVRNMNDISYVRAACESLEELSEHGIKVNIAFEIPPEERMNPELQEALNDVVDEYENIERDTGEEFVDSSTDMLMEGAVRMGVAQAIRENKENNKDSIINQLTKGADVLLDPLGIALNEKDPEGEREIRQPIV